MEPLTAGAGLALGIAQLINNQGAQENAMSTAAQNLAFQREQAAEAKREAQATRTDAYGNQQRYNPATNAWETILTPMQQAITKAGEGEQLKSLTEDAQRNRDFRKRQEQNSLNAEQPLNTALTGYQYNQPASEGATQDKLTTLMMQANQDRGKSTQADLVKQSLRQGRGNDVNALVKAIDDKIGSSSGDTVLQSTQAAHSQHAGDVQAHNQQYLPQIQALEQIINNGGGGATTRFSDTPDKLSGVQGQQQAGMLGAISNAMSGINSASSTLAKTEAKGLDFSSLIKAMSGLSKGGKTDTTAESWDKPPAKVDYSTIPDYLGDIEYGRKDSNGFSF